MGKLKDVGKLKLLSNEIYESIDFINYIRNKMAHELQLHKISINNKVLSDPDFIKDIKNKGINVITEVKELI